MITERKRCDLTIEIALPSDAKVKIVMSLDDLTDVQADDVRALFAQFDLVARKYYQEHR